MTLHIERIARASWQGKPWGKDQGITHEVRRWDDGGAGYRARVSVAEIVADGPFTPMPGYRRWLAVLDPGGGLELRVGGAGEIADARTVWHGVRGASIELDGGAAIDARVSGRARVWNLIARADVAWTAAWATETLARSAGTTIIHAPGAATRVAIASREFLLDADETLVVEAPLLHTIEPHGPLIVIHFDAR